jgi:single-strand DNA-binding protein
MHSDNVVVLRGRVSSPPRATDLPSGSVLVHLEVTTQVDDTAVSVPVAWFDPGRAMQPQADDDIVVVGHVRRRFFRAGGVVQSRTEVVAEHVVPARRRRQAERLVAAAVVALTRADGSPDPSAASG